MNKHFLYAALCVLLCSPASALAYLGPGAGLSAIGSILALIGATLLLVVGFVWYPVKRLLKNRKNQAVKREEDSE